MKFRLRAVLGLLTFLLSSSGLAESLDLQNLIAQKIMILDRPLLTFHYRQWNKDPTLAPEALDLVKRATEDSFRVDLDHDSNMVGPGLYSNRTSFQYQPALIPMLSAQKSLDFKAAMMWECRLNQPQVKTL